MVNMCKSLNKEDCEKQKEKCDFNFDQEPDTA